MDNKMNTTWIYEYIKIVWIKGKCKNLYNTLNTTWHRKNNTWHGKNTNTIRIHELLDLVYFIPDKNPFCTLMLFIIYETNDQLIAHYKSYAANKVININHSHVINSSCRLEHSQHLVPLILSNRTNLSHVILKHKISSYDKWIGEPLLHMIPNKSPKISCNIY